MKTMPKHIHRYYGEGEGQLSTIACRVAAAQLAFSGVLEHGCHAYIGACPGEGEGQVSPAARQLRAAPGQPD